MIFLGWLVLAFMVYVLALEVGAMIRQTPPPPHLVLPISGSKGFVRIHPVTIALASVLTVLALLLR